MDRRTQIETFVRDIKARNRRETITGLVVLPVFAAVAAVLPVPLLRYAFVLLFLGIGVVLVMIRTLGALRGDLAQFPADNVEHWRGEMRRQARLLRWVPVWYLAPLVPGSVLALWFARTVPGHFLLRLALIQLVVFGAVAWTNVRAAGRLDDDARLLGDGEANPVPHSGPSLGSP